MSLAATAGPNQVGEKIEHESSTKSDSHSLLHAHCGHVDWHYDEVAMIFSSLLRTHVEHCMTINSQTRASNSGRAQTCASNWSVSVMSKTMSTHHH